MAAGASCDRLERQRELRHARIPILIEHPQMSAGRSVVLMTSCCSLATNSRGAVPLVIALGCGAHPP